MFNSAEQRYRLERDSYFVFNAGEKYSLTVGVGNILKINQVKINVIESSDLHF